MKNKIGKSILQMVLILWGLLQIYPLYWLILFSLKSNTEIFGTNVMGLPENPRWGNYVFAFVHGDVGRYLFNSILVTTATIVFTTLFSLMASYALTRMRWKFRQSMSNMLALGLMIPIHASILPVMIIFKNLKILSTYWALIIPYVAFAIPISIMIYGGFMQSIATELEEAACIDGCNIYKLFFTIICPIMKPAIATAAIFNFLSSWNELMFATILISKSEYKTLTVGIQSLVGQYSTDWGPIGAGLVIATMPIILIYVLMSKQVQKSLMAGAIKG